LKQVQSNLGKTESLFGFIRQLAATICNCMF